MLKVFGVFGLFDVKLIWSRKSKLPVLLLFWVLVFVLLLVDDDAFPEKNEFKKSSSLSFLLLLFLLSSISEIKSSFFFIVPLLSSYKSFSLSFLILSKYLWTIAIKLSKFPLEIFPLTKIEIKLGKILLAIEIIVTTLAISS